MKAILVPLSLGLSLGALAAADAPSVAISNEQIQVRIYLPGAKNGYYRGTRFDWSGVVHSLTYKGHEFYGPWFHKTDPNVRDFIYQGADIIAGPCSAITGPVDEFAPLGFDGAKPGDSFLKIGIGALRKPDGAKYDNYRLYELVGAGKWTVAPRRDSVEFTHDLDDPSSGYSYRYRKTIRLTPGQPVMTLEHRLLNKGSRTMETTVYNHNFLVLDQQPPGPGLVITVPFGIESPRPPRKELAGIRGRQIVYLKTLEDRDVVSTPVQGFGGEAKDHEIRIENSKAGVGMSIRGDRPLASENLWSIRTVMAMEPFIAIRIEPGKEFTWTSTYRYYTLLGAGSR